MLAERAEHRLGSVDTSHDNDLRGSPLVRAASHDVEPAHVVESYVEEDDPDVVPANRVQRLQTILSSIDAESIQCEKRSDTVSRRLVVVDNQDIIVSHSAPS